MVIGLCFVNSTAVLIGMQVAISVPTVTLTDSFGMKCYCCLFSAMYQTEILPDIDKVSKLVNQSHTIQEVPEQDVKALTQSAEPDHVTAGCHDESLPHPSEVLIKLKVGIILYLRYEAG